MADMFRMVVIKLEHISANGSLFGRDSGLPIPTFCTLLNRGISNDKLIGIYKP